MFLFFDTETTGVPAKYNAPVSDLNNWPRVIQLAWALYDKDQKLLYHRCTLIRPNGWSVPAEKFWIENGFTQLKNEMEGEPIDNALRKFLLPLSQSKFLIAHNIKFDIPIVQAEMIRANVSAINRPVKICTMESATNVCRIPGRNGYKWPKLAELHQHLFNEGFEGAHDALADVKACARCFFKLVELGHISLS